MSSTGVENVKFNNGLMPGRFHTGLRSALRHCLRITLVVISALLLGSMAMLFPIKPAGATTWSTTIWVEDNESPDWTSSGTISILWGESASFQLCTSGTVSENLQLVDGQGYFSLGSKSAKTGNGGPGGAVACSVVYTPASPAFPWYDFGTDGFHIAAGSSSGDKWNSSGTVVLNMAGNGVSVSTGLGSSYTYGQSVNVSSTASCGGCNSTPFTGESGTLPNGLSWNGSGFSGTIAQVGSFSGTLTATEDGANSTTGSSGSANWSFTVGQASQTISITSTAPNGVAYSGSNNQTYNVTASATSGLTPTLTIDGSSTSGCTISGTTVYYGGGIGSCIIDANQAGNGNYTAAGQSQQSFTVGQAANTITVTSSAPGSAVVGGTTYTPTATATSGDTVVITSATTSVCTISSGIVSFLTAGTCTLDFNDTGNSNYVAATQQTQSFSVGKGANTITVTSPAPTNATVGGATYTPTATATSGDTVVITSATTTVCTISSGVVSFLTANTCTLNFNDAGNSNYGAATQRTQSFSVAKANQTITFTSTASSPTVGGTYTVTATGGASGNQVTFSIDATTTGACTSSGTNGATITFLTTGNCTIDANQAGNANYNAAALAQQTVTGVAKANQTITFTSTASSSTVGGTYTVTATGGASGNQVTFSIDATTTGACTSSGTNGATITFLTTGNCTIDANQAGNANYNAAALAQQTVTGVAKANQTITFTSTASSPTVGGTYTVTATGGASGNQVTFSIDATTTGACTSSGTNGATITFLTTGNCTIDANQAGNANYNAAALAQQTVTGVAKGTNTITVTSSAPGSAVVGGTTYTPTATATSGDTVVITSATTSVCTISSGIVSFLTAGTCTLNFNDVGNSNYVAATQQTQKL